MTFDDDEWERGRSSDTRKGQIQDFLESNSDHAWTATEVANETGELTGDMDSLAGLLANGISVSSVKDDLEELVREGEIEKKTISDEMGGRKFTGQNRNLERCIRLKGRSS